MKLGVGGGGGGGERAQEGEVTRLGRLPARPYDLLF